MASEFIQVGFTAMRDPATREYMPAVPLYIRNEDGAGEQEQKLIDDIGKLFAQRMRDIRNEPAVS